MSIVARTRYAALLLAVLACVVTGCTSPSTPPARPSTAGGVPPVVVGSFNFDESIVLGEIYAQALEHAGIPVRREFDLGPRELVWPALRQGMVDVLPEYLGTAVVTATGRVGAGHEARPLLVRALRKALASWHLTALAPAAAVDQNGFAVTAATAKRYRLVSLSDLAPVAARMVLGGPSECPRRLLCLLGLRRVYGIRFRGFEPFDDATQRLTAVDQGVIDVELTFTTDGQLATGALVLLRDDKHLQPDEAVIPVVSDRVLGRYGTRLTRALDAVSAELDSRSLTFLNWRVSVAGKDPRSEAHAWLRRHGLLGGP